jgi:hypothetical protein
MTTFITDRKWSPIETEVASIDHPTGTISPTLRASRIRKRSKKSKKQSLAVQQCDNSSSIASTYSIIMDNSKVRIIRDILASITDTSSVVARPCESPEVARAMSAMDLLTLEDIGLTASRVADANISQCFEICSSEAFQLAVFIVPAGGKLHLHDHPEMCVMSKLITGEMQLTSYTRATSADPNSVDIPVGPGSVEVMRYPVLPWSLSADNNNFHELVALTPTVVFEALVCPYSDDRPCTYYEAYDSVLLPGTFLRVVEPPEDGPIGIEM